MLLYNALLGIALALALPVALIVVPLWPRARRGFWQRLRPLPRGERSTLWLHAASVGEAEAAAPLVASLLERGVPILATTMTATGRERLRARFPKLPVRLAPLDLPGLVHRSLVRARISALVLVETEIWPTAISATAAAGGAVVIAGGRISDRSLRRYQRFGFFFRPLFARLSRVGARDAEDARRFAALGVPAERCSVIGDLKLDRQPAAAPGERLRSALGPGPFLVAGSTHAGEEEALIRAWRRLRRTAAGPRLVLVPRHPERAGDVLATARRLGASAALRSQGSAEAEVVVVDTVGELARLYHLADLVFSGGSLVPVGGHNLVEPVQARKVVVHGPHLENQRTQQRLLQPLGVLHRVGDETELAATLERLWRDPERNRPAERAAASLAAHRGATERALKLVLEAFEGSTGA